MDPFRYGQVVSGEYFCPRPELAKALQGYIKAGQNVYVQGERRIGKTSLISETVAGLPAHRPVYIDLLGIKSVDMLVKEIAAAVIRMGDKRDNLFERMGKYLARLGLSFSFDPVTAFPSVAIIPGARPDGPDSLDAALDLIGSIHTAKRPVVVILDEFQAILGLKNHAGIVARMRGKIQFQPKIPYVFAGSIRHKMEALFVSPDSPFFKSAVQLSVGPLDEKIFRKHLAGRFKKGKREISDTVLDEVFRVCDGITGDVQQFCSALWSVTEEKTRITEKALPEALAVIFGRERAGYEATVENISEQQLKCLVGVARHGGRETTGIDFLGKTGIPLAASAQKALERLVQLRILFRQRAEYRFTNPFFREWLLRRGF